MITSLEPDLETITRLQAAYDSVVAGPWSFCQINTEKGSTWGIIQNDKIVATNMSMEDACLVDTMHLTFKDLLKAAKAKIHEISSLEQKVADLELALEAAKIEVTRWKEIATSAKKAHIDLVTSVT